MANTKEPDDSYEVGYGRPPKGGQFRQGQSGNAKGRPKGSRNLATIVQKEGRQLVRVNGPRGSRLICKVEAAVMQLGNKAVQGDTRAIGEYLSLFRICEQSAQADHPPLTPHERDATVMQSLLKRIRSAAEATGDTESPNEPSGRTDK